MTKLFDLKSTHNPNRYYLPVVDELCVGPPKSNFLFGGVGLGTSIAAMERTTGRPTVWATAQYLSYARPGETVDLDVVVPVQGKYNSQARVIGHVGDREIFTVVGALGERPSEISTQWAQMPDVPSPESCPVREHWRKDANDLHSQMETRIAKGRFSIEERDGTRANDSQALLWARMRPGVPIDTSALAIFADLVPSGIGHALGIHAGGNSLDNTLRVRKLVSTEWVLCDIRIHGVHGGFAHGRMLLFSEGGELMATASQSLILRIHNSK